MSQSIELPVNGGDPQRGNPSSSCFARCRRLVGFAVFIIAVVVAIPIKCWATVYTDVRDFESLCQFAASKAEGEYKPSPPLPEPLASWQYDDYIQVRYRPDRATWYKQGLPFWLETFHRGFVQTDLVELFTLNPSPNGEPICQRIAFNQNDFVYGESLDAGNIPPAGHAGFRVIGRFPNRSDAQEILSFLGSSYFRSRSADTVYGASARGLAINIAMMEPEEFPDFRAFWIQMPSQESEQVSVLAFLDSPSVTGAYRFQLQPGEASTRIKVQAQIFYRDEPEKIALAPLTSMWIWGDGLQGPPKDKRPAVHDSDGLLIQSGADEWTWRAFARQSYPSVSSKQVEHLHGFGLIQRNRAFYHYDDHNARYDLRPSVWVTPDQPWPNGRIELLELPGAHEGVDNLAAYWLPSEDDSAAADTPTESDSLSTQTSEPANEQAGAETTVGEEASVEQAIIDPASRRSPDLDLSYTVSFFAGDPAAHNVLGRATNLDVRRPEKDSDPIELEIRFAGPLLRGLPADHPPTIRCNAVAGKMHDQSLERTDEGDWILQFLVSVDPEAEENQPVDLTLQLYSEDQPVTETFAYLLPPREPEFVYPAVYTRQE
ncbi:glucan biosynthesis protein [Rhodopirellula halodulae]|uniref:glucan biosynthesis protein n=1 Tax=Rhodopirellula halodulae TaxID=2894198 RepID=UPI001E4764BF|nr:glucan biosynthesis protein [Rhodopirellula sp. JC737]MCC9657879.1 glucan biosynthesis protein [Rhodopirellula sp. JC737]